MAREVLATMALEAQCTLVLEARRTLAREVLATMALEAQCTLALEAWRTLVLEARHMTVPGALATMAPVVRHMMDLGGLVILDPEGPVETAL